MKLWPFNRGARNPQASAGPQAPPAGDYTDRVVAALVASATGGRSDPGALAVVEFASSLLARTLSRATVEAAPDVARAVTGHLLAMVARELVRRGEALFAIDVSPFDGSVDLAPAASWDVRGSHRPESWRYRCDLFSPGGSVTRLLPAAGVAHFRWNTPAARPWTGQSAIALASATSATAGETERSLANEAKVTIARVAASGSATAGQAKEYGERLAEGGIVPAVGGVAPMSTGGMAPTSAWRPERMGPEPAGELVELRRDVAREVLEAIGIPSTLFNPTASEGSQRAAFRRFLTATAAPACELVADELTRKLETPVRLDLGALATPDALASEARARGSKASAYAHLVGAGMDKDEAQEKAGL